MPSKSGTESDVCSKFVKLYNDKAPLMQPHALMSLASLLENTPRREWKRADDRKREIDAARAYDAKRVECKLCGIFTAGEVPMLAHVAGSRHKKAQALSTIASIPLTEFGKVAFTVE